MDLNRYSRQIIFHEIGNIGQEKLLDSKVAIVGMGALGSVIANNLCRAGVGHIKLIDRDYVELTNLQRQSIFDEDDADKQTPKAVAAYEHLLKINSEIKLEPIVIDVNSANVEELLDGMDLVLDGTDNVEIRYLLNEVCLKKQIPWIYGGVLGAYGSTMNIIPDETPCFKCVYPNPPLPGSYQTCSTVGVINMITGTIACVESTEAIKILIDSPDVRKTLMVIDLWYNSIEYIEVQKDLACSVCAGHDYRFLGHLMGAYTTSLCGRDSIQVVPRLKSDINFEFLAERLKGLGEVKYNEFMLSFSSENIAFNLFPDGRAIIKNIKNEMMAKSVYSEYIGL